MILTKRLRLSYFKMDYAEEFTKTLHDPMIFEYLPESVPDLNDIKKLIERFIERDIQNEKVGFTGTNLAIIAKDTNEIIGWCGIQPFEPMSEKKEIFYELSPTYWNKGYMTEAAGSVLQYGFEELHLEEIVAGVKPNNIASIKVLEKIGFAFQRIITDVPEGSEFYLGERFYTISKDHI